jgi:DNA repair protein RadC
MPESIPQIAEISISYKPIITKIKKITSSKDAYDVLYPFFDENTIALQEHFMVMFLNHSNQVLGVYPVSKGGISGTVADVRLILGVALKCAASSIILVHNHPSGNLTPSTADEMLTLKVKHAGEYMDIKLIDHLIVTPLKSKYYSFLDEGKL